MSLALMFCYLLIYLGTFECIIFISLDVLGMLTTVMNIFSVYHRCPCVVKECLHVSSISVPAFLFEAEICKQILSLLI